MNGNGFAFFRAACLASTSYEADHECIIPGQWYPKLTDEQLEAWRKIRAMRGKLNFADYLTNLNGEEQ